MNLMLRRNIMMAQGGGSPTPVQDSILTFTALEANSTVALTKVGSPPNKSFVYSTDGINYTSYTAGDVITLPNVDDFVKFKAASDNGTMLNTSGNNYHQFVMSGSIGGSGDVTSLLNGVGGVATIATGAFKHLFENCSSLVSAPDLPSTELYQYSYQAMFRGCTALTSAPVIAATSASGLQACVQMFYGCTSLEVAPELLVETTSATYLYNEMFSGCSSLNYLKIHLQSNANKNIQSMLNGVSGSGTLVCPQSLTITTPTGWTRVDLV